MSKSVHKVVGNVLNDITSIDQVGDIPIGWTVETHPEGARYFYNSENVSEVFCILKSLDDDIYCRGFTPMLTSMMKQRPLLSSRVLICSLA